MGNKICCDPSYQQKVNGFSQNQILPTRSLGKEYKPSLTPIPSAKEEEDNKINDSKNKNNEQNIEAFILNNKQIATKKLLLSIDEVWVDNMLQQGHDILQIYQRFDNEIRRTTTAEHNKVQLLFNETISKIGWSYFSITILSYIPSEGYQFVLGVIDCIKGREKLHSWMLSCQQGYNFSEEKVLGLGDQKYEPVQCNFKLVLAISLEEGKICYYRNSDLFEEQKIRAQLLQNNPTIVPYIQTFKKGVQFYWERPIKPTNPKNIFTIPEENSNGNGSMVIQ